MDLTALPARLAKEQAQEWSDWIFEVAGTKREVNALAARLEEENENVNSVRAELSRFLNGHTHIVARWLGDKPSNKGEALCRLLRVSASSLQARYMALIPPPRATGLTVEHLRHLPVRIRQDELSNGLAKLYRALQIDEEFQISDKDWPGTWADLRDHLQTIAKHSNRDSPRATHLSLNHPRQNRAWRRGQVSCAHTLLKRRVEQFIGEEQTRDLSASEDPFSPANSDTLKIQTRPIAHAELDVWLSQLEDLAIIPHDVAEKVRAFFAEVPVATLDSFSPEQLVRAVEDIREGRLRSPDARSINARRVEWERKALQNGAPPHAAKWLQRTRHSFIRWIETAGALHGDLNRSELNRVLDLQEARNVDPDSHIELLEKLVHLESPEELEQVQEKLLQHLPDILVPALKKSEFIEEVGEDRYRLTSRTLAFAELEIPPHLDPDVLATHDVNANDHLIVEAVRLAKPESLPQWFSAAITIQGVDQPMVMLAVMRGLARRNDLDKLRPSKALTTLWASTIWACLHGLHIAQEPYSGFEFLFATDISPSLAHLLPRLDEETPLRQSLQSLVAPPIADAVARWQSKLALFSQKTDEFIFRHAPFQVPYARIEESTLNQVFLAYNHHWTCHPHLHHAQQGDTHSRLEILAGLDPFFSRRDEIPLPTLLEWRREVIDHLPSDNRVTAFLGIDLVRALQQFFIEDNPDLLRPLRALLEDEELHSSLPSPSQEVVTAISSGPSAALEWLLNNPEDIGWQDLEQTIEKNQGDRENEIPPDEFLLGIVKILNDRDFLRALIAFELNAVAQSPTELRRLFLGEPNEPTTTVFAPNLAFPRLRLFSRLRSDALLLLAQLGDAAPLRESLAQQWRICNDRLAGERAFWRTLCDAVTARNTNTPPPDDEQWEDLLRTLAWRPLDATLPDLEPFMLDWFEAPDPEGSVPYYFLAIRDVPPAKRWLLIKPYLHRLWRYHNRYDRPIIFNVLATTCDLTKQSDTWWEPKEFLEARKDWALQHDGEYIRSWCDQLHNLLDLARDLDWADSVWSHLTSDQQLEVLRNLSPTSSTPLAEIWWQRSQLLPTKDQLDFARRHGTLPDQRKIARQWVEKSVENRLDRYLDLFPAERPDPALIDADLDAFLNTIKPSEFNPSHLSVLRRLIRTPSASLCMRLLPDFIDQRARSCIQENDSFKALQEALAQSPVSDLLSTLAHDPKAKLTDENLKTVRDEVSNIKRRLIDFAQKLESSDTNRRHFPDIEAELDAWEERIKAALSPKPDSTPTEDTDPLTKARQKLETLDFADENAGLEFLSLVWSVPEQKREELLKAILPHSQLATNETVLREVIDLIDRSNLEAEKATTAGRQWMEAFEQARTDNRIVVSALLNTGLALRRTPLRRLFRKRAEELLTSIHDRDT